MSEYVSINLNTKFANNVGVSAYLTEPSWYLPEAIHDITSVKLKSFTIPLSVYTIDSRNNKLQFIEAGSTSSNRVITLPSSNYSGITLASQLTSALNSVGSYTYAVNYTTSGTNVLSFSATGGSFAFTSIANDAYYECGLDTQLDTLSTTKTSDTIDLSGVNTIHLVSNVGACDVINQDFKILATIPVEESPLAVSQFQDDSNDYINCNIPSLAEVRFRLYDARFRRITPTKDFNATVNFICDKSN